MTKCQSERKNLNIEALEDRLRAAGMKLTAQRQQILKILLHHPEPISADEMFKKFQSKSAGMDLVTIYRILKKFEEADFVSRMEFGDGVARFELTLESGHHHHHVICRSCQKVEALHICDLDHHILAVEKMGYKQVNHRLDFFALCPNCQ